jgi:hypothetical protein
MFLLIAFSVGSAARLVVQLVWDAGEPHETEPSQIQPVVQ